MRFGLQEEILIQMTRVLAAFPSVKRAVIFGSRARGEFRPNSEIDIAAITEAELPGGRYSELDEASGIYKINLVDLTDLTNQNLCENVRTEGLEIYVR